MRLTVANDSGIAAAAAAERGKAQHGELNQVATNNGQHPFIVGQVNPLTSYIAHLHYEIVAVWIQNHEVAVSIFQWFSKRSARQIAEQSTNFGTGCQMAQYIG